MEVGWAVRRAQADPGWGWTVLGGKAIAEKDLRQMKCVPVLALGMSVAAVAGFC
jgi:hypothetical protein